MNKKAYILRNEKRKLIQREKELRALISFEKNNKRCQSKKIKFLAFQAEKRRHEKIKLNRRKKKLNEIKLIELEFRKALIDKI